MARPWRDVISVRGWDAAVVGSRSRTKGESGKVAKLRSLFEDKFKSPDSFLLHIREKLVAYHAINKMSLETIEQRRAALLELSELAMKYLKTFNVDVDKAAQRSMDRRNAFSGRISGGDPSDETADRNILSLARRALRKREYLLLLKNFYSRGGAGVALRDADALLEFLNKPQDKTSELVGISPGVRMEQLDFMHRGDYETDDMGAISCGAAFHEWTQDPLVAGAIPFFLWLEGHRVCLEDNKDLLETGAVEYVRSDNRQGGAAIAKLRMVVFGGTLCMIALDGTLVGKTIASTAGYKSEGAKDPRSNMRGPNGENYLGDGVAAYVWTEQKELFIAQHMGQQFHHSSFVSGRRVRCAGMIAIENGRVVALSNNSGHYKPRKEHVRNFVEFLSAIGCIAQNCHLKVHVGGGHAWQGSVANFLMHFGNLEFLAAQTAAMPKEQLGIADHAAKVAKLREHGGLRSA